MKSFTKLELLDHFLLGQQHGTQQWFSRFYIFKWWGTFEKMKSRVDFH